MAASLKVGGYQCKFIVDVPDDLLCKSCRYVARQPHLTSCCGAHYCHTCISTILQDKKPCPSCKEETFTIFMNRREHQKILALRVCCRLKDSGCQWMGRLEQLKTHLDTNTGDCQYLNVECPEKCGQQVQKHHLATHIANECPKRDFTCMYCGFKATYEVVSEKHWPECQNYPVPCPNRCQIGSVERNTLEDHLNMCRLGIVECDFSYAGCNEKLQRQDMEKHVEKNTQKHLALIAAASMKLSQEFEKKLQEQRDEFQGYLEQKDQQIIRIQESLQERIKAVEQRREEQIKSLEVQSQQQVKKIGNLEKQLKEKEQELELRLNIKLGVPPFHLTMYNFNLRKTRDKNWFSPVMYTHPRGYKFCILVKPYGNSSIGSWWRGEVYHVSVSFLPREGEFDDFLQWPAKFTITLQLLNQHRDRNHITMTKQFEWRGMSRSQYFTEKLLAHNDLEFNAQKQAQYLKDDCLRFCISKIEAQM